MLRLPAPGAVGRPGDEDTLLAGGAESDDMRDGVAAALADLATIVGTLLPLVRNNQPLTIPSENDSDNVVKYVRS